MKLLNTIFTNLKKTNFHFKNLSISFLLSDKFKFIPVFNKYLKTHVFAYLETCQITDWGGTTTVIYGHK